MTPRSGFEEFLQVMLAAAEMIDDLDGQRAREAAAAAEAYRMGFEAGREVGYRQAETDMEKAWQSVAEGVRDLPAQMAAAERRYPGYTAERLAALRAQARERFGLPSRGR